jgi:hypothetical protein
MCSPFEEKVDSNLVMRIIFNRLSNRKLFWFFRVNLTFSLFVLVSLYFLAQIYSFTMNENFFLVEKCLSKIRFSKEWKMNCIFLNPNSSAFLCFAMYMNVNFWLEWHHSKITATLILKELVMWRTNNLIDSQIDSDIQVL